MIHFITFATHDNYLQAGERLTNQATNLEIFDNIKLHTLDNLKNDIIFWNQHKDFIENNIKGYGYWLWKPYLIKKEMDLLNDNDILLYLDSGCEIDILEKDYFIKCIKHVTQDYIIGTLGKTNVEESCKMDLLMLLNMNDTKYLQTKMHQAGAILIFICDKTRKLINEWYDLCCNYHLINDGTSVNQNLDTFKEHRHDQSIYCLLTKKYDIYSSIDLGYKCIKYIRNRTGISLFI